MDHQHLELINRVLECEKHVRRYPYGKTKRDLHKMYNNILHLNTERDKALVECRRFGKITSEYQRKQKDLEIALDYLEQYITMAMLIRSE